MQILSVTLTNFKTHRDRFFQFQVGTNAICGENGAGKTSILEAIAWVLFNYTGDYNKTDLIRNGAGSAQAIVELVSSKDGRTYQIRRCTSRGYTLYDPQLDVQLPYTRINDEVMPWLREHMGVSPGTDLGRLFANTVGVPQGTFTVDFLLPAEKRKPIFDAILKVEEYRQTNQKMLSLEKYAKAQSEILQAKISEYEETLQSWDSLQQRRQQTRQEIAQQEAELQRLQTTLTDLQQVLEEGRAKVRQVQTVQAQLQAIAAQIQAQSQVNLRLQQSLAQAQQAVQLCEQYRSDHAAYLEIEAAIQALEQTQKTRYALWKQRDQHQKDLSHHQTTLTRLALQLESFDQGEAELRMLQASIQQQETLEQEQAAVNAELQALQQTRLEHQALQQRIAHAQSNLASLTQEIEQTQALAAVVQQIPVLEQQRDRIQQQLSRVEAAQQFETELTHLVQRSQAKRDRYQTQASDALGTLKQLRESIPLLASAPVDSILEAIRAGVTLNDELLTALQDILGDLAEQVSVPRLQQQHHQVKTQLDSAYQSQAQFRMLDAQRSQQAALNQDLQQQRSQRSQLQEQLGAEAHYQQQAQQIAGQLQQLQNPKGRQQLLQQQLQQRPKVQAQYARLQSIQADIQQRIQDCDRQLAAFADLDEQIEGEKARRQTHQAGYLIYVQHEKQAQQVSPLEAELQTAIAQLHALKAQESALQTQYNQLAASVDPEQMQQQEATYRELQSQADQIRGGLPQQRKLLAELDQRVAELQDIADKRDRAQQELKDRDRIKRFISFARKAYKEAGPRITERYVQSISHEADRLFRELMNRPNVALTWTRDYEILIQEGPHSRRFINLSGGEQMCAALAVRLALLKVLADLDIAFFDEPTTNMDRSRRESLAEAIARIRSFRQLFVISHDDTFEQVTENVILVEREV